jgi:lincosamide nucleotidyltransferase A/C/D/E
MDATDVLELLDCLDRAGVRVWLDGGWGVDALLRQQTRDHDDLDLVASLGDVPKLEEALGRGGFATTGGGAPKSFEMTDQAGRQVDVHPVTFTSSGDGVYLMQNGDEWIYPASGFEGVGQILGTAVRCLTPEVQLLCHEGYELPAEHRQDVAALRERFRLPSAGR